MSTNIIASTNTSVNISVTSLKRGKVHSLSIPDLRNKKKVLRTIKLTVRESEDTDTKHSFHIAELKIVSNGKILWTVSPTLLNRLEDQIEVLDPYSLDNATNLILQIRPTSDCDGVDLVLEYGEHDGYPLYHNECSSKNVDDRHNFLENLVKEMSKIQVTKIDLLVNSPNIELLKITDPYMVNGNSYQINVKKENEGQFPIVGEIFEVELNNISDLSRANLDFFDSENKTVFPELVGAIIWGFSL